MTAYPRGPFASLEWVGMQLSLLGRALPLLGVVTRSPEYCMVVWVAGVGTCRATLHLTTGAKAQEEMGLEEVKS